MNTKYLIIIISAVVIFSQMIFAQEITALNIDTSKNYIQSGFSAATARNSESGGGGFIMFYRRITDQLLLGIGHDVFNVHTGATSDDCLGDLATANCITTNYAIEGKSIEFSSVYYFKNQGYKNWGFYVGPAVGYSGIKMTGNFDRYDVDPGIFCGLFGGNCRRNVEAGPKQTKSYNSAYVKLGLGYQFIWTPNLAIAGHILDLGVTYSQYLDKETFDINLPNGDKKSILYENSVQGKISYAVVF